MSICKRFGCVTLSKNLWTSKIIKQYFFLNEFFWCLSEIFLSRVKNYQNHYLTSTKAVRTENTGPQNTDKGRLIKIMTMEKHTIQSSHYETFTINNVNNIIYLKLNGT